MVRLLKTLERVSSIRIPEELETMEELVTVTSSLPTIAKSSSPVRKSQLEKCHADSANPEGAVALAARHHVASIDHLEYVTVREARQLVEAGIMITLLPSASFSGDAREAPARALIDIGVAVALGSNFNPHHAPGLNMQTVVALACGRLGMSVEEAISAATINGAH